jgi:ABC-type bacteriocin/lantibiotic exporter with double-glycine peptidase domain
MQLLRTIFIILAIYYIGKYLMRFFAPFIMKYAANKMEKKMKDQFGNNQPNKENDFSNKSKDKLKSTKKVGDYIDFEEID